MYASTFVVTLDQLYKRRTFTSRVFFKQILQSLLRKILTPDFTCYTQSKPSAITSNFDALNEGLHTLFRFAFRSTKLIRRVSMGQHAHVYHKILEERVTNISVL